MQEEPLNLKEIVTNTAGDYFADDIGDIVYAPSVYDMLIVTTANDIKHNKGYLMQQVIPQNDG